MNIIHVLPESVKRKIAAGEVVEGPFSVIKELLENSIDAGASIVDVEVDDAGLKRILVKDNGSGIYRDDLYLSIEEHATSKIQSDMDIGNILTLGFRGEALSSISSVSKLTILSRSVKEATGGRLVASDSDVTITDYAGPVGTTVIVENLFFNTPARKNFLKTASTELRYIREVIFRMALVHPEITFTITFDGKRVHSFQSVPGIEQRIEQVYGTYVTENLVYEKLEDSDIAIEGYLSLPSYSRPQRSLQHLYINGRPVFHQYLGYLLQKSYEGMLKRGQHPAAILMITTSPQSVDINVHPSKREVRFADQKRINRLIMNFASKILNTRVHQMRIEHEIPSAAVHEEQGGAHDIQQRFSNGTVMPSRGQHGYEVEESTITDTWNDVPMESRMGNNFISDFRDLYIPLNEWGDDVHILGIAFGTYILVEENESIMIIDYHAAHERMLYDRIIDDEHDIEIQQLVFPKVMELTPEIYDNAMESLEYLNKNGFDIEDFSDNSIIIRGVPSYTAHMDQEKIILDILDVLDSENDILGNIRKSIAETLACHSARRANEDLSQDEIVRIIQFVSRGNEVMRCPHGRPIAYSLTKNEIERFFKRS
ncbi:MAG: DNA mismatch repair endonuclease MutL [Spirochaetota bacterium]